MGTHKSTYQGKETGRTSGKIAIGFEFPTKLHVFDEKKGPEPFTLTARYTKTFNRQKGKLLPMLDAWRGEPLTKEMITAFSFDKLIGKPATVTVVHKKKDDGSVMALISTITQLGEGMTCPPAILPTLLYTVDWEPNHEAFKLLPEWMQDECRKCLEWAPTTAAESSHAANEAGPNSEEEGGSNNW